MKVLQICSKPPYPPHDGGALAMNMITQGLLSAGTNVKVIAVSSNKNAVQFEQLPPEYIHATKIETVYIDLDVKYFPAMKNLLLNRSYHIERFRSPALKEKIIRVLSEDHYDIIQLESLFMTPYLSAIRQVTSAPVILRSHNIEFRIWKSIAEKLRNPLKRMYISHLSSTLKNYELKCMNEFDGIAAISTADADYYIRSGCTLPVAVIPYGIDLPENAPYGEPVANLFSIAAMNWLPNTEGLRWFIDHVWPEVHEKYPGLIFRIAGRGMADDFKQMNKKGIEIIGEVPDSLDFMVNNGIMVVPLFAGSGIRVKIIEGMYAGKTIISTPAGVAGINCTDGENILIAENKEEFIAQISRCMENDDMVKKIGNSANVFASKNFNSVNIINDLLAFYEKVINLKKNS